jgi:hypothetical protein
MDNDDSLQAFDLAKRYDIDNSWIVLVISMQLRDQVNPC